MTTSSGKILLKTPRFDVLQIEATDPRYSSDFYIQKHDGVSVAVVSSSSVLMLEIERRGQGRLSLEFPGGRIEHGEGALMAARRELTEEIDLVCNEFESIGSIAPLPGLISERVHLLVAYVLPEMAATAKVHPGHEGIQRLRTIEISALPELCADGQISSAVDGYFALRLAGAQRTDTPGVWLD